MSQRKKDCVLEPEWRQEPPRSWSWWRSQNPCTCSSASLGSPDQITKIRSVQNDKDWFFTLTFWTAPKGPKSCQRMFSSVSGARLYTKMHHLRDHQIHKMYPASNCEKCVLSTRTRSRWWLPCRREGNLPQADRQPEENTCRRNIKLPLPLDIPSFPCILGILGRATEVGPQLQKVQRDKSIWEIMGAIFPWVRLYLNLKASLQPPMEGFFTTFQGVILLTVVGQDFDFKWMLNLTSFFVWQESGVTETAAGKGCFVKDIMGSNHRQRYHGIES